MLRFNLGLFPEQSRENASWIAVLALIGIVYGALVAMVQPNMKKLIAYSSISHLGFVVLGIFSFTQAGLNGAMFVMLAHGISTGGLFMLAGILYERRHTYEISEFGGLATPMPAYSTFFLFIVLASVGEFLVLSGAFQHKMWWGIVGATGVIWSACYLLWMYQRVFFGTVKHAENNSLPDLDLRERVALWPAAVMALVMGIAPLWWLNAIDPAVHNILASFSQLAAKVVTQ
jgi:NADH-quinone oxidoreductase subunit M